MFSPLTNLIRWGLGLLERMQFLRFLLVGSINTLVGYALIFAGMYLLHLSPELSNLLGYSVGLVISYFLNKYYTFKSNESSHTEKLRFLMVFAVAYPANLALLMFLTRILGLHAGLSQIVAGALYVVVSYLMNRRFVFSARQPAENISSPNPR